MNALHLMGRRGIGAAICERFAAAVPFLTSDASRSIAGAVLALDGGFTSL